MSITVDATYENGVLKPETPLPLDEHKKVRLTVEPQASPILKAYGIMGWTGDAEALRRLACDPEFDPLDD